ncbi:MAG: hypothetical protein M1839_006128 [Geoglossum umbratile]|nr:MAG: hypothetical protein M1839_006128 [Geoglossum umbratile]
MAAPANGTAVAAEGRDCGRANWKDVGWFLFRNYFIHALTVRSLPGESPFFSVIFKLSCLLVPYAGVTRGLCLLLRASRLTPNDLRAAVRSGAMCMVVRNDKWMPQDGDVIEGCEIEATAVGDEVSVSSGSSSFGGAEQKALQGVGRVIGHDGEVRLNVKSPYKPLRQPTFAGMATYYLVQSYRFRERRVEESITDVSSTKIQGVYSLPRGYSLAYVPHDVEVRPRYSSPHQRPAQISSSINIPRILFSLFQTVAGGISLYHARGAQIDKWGYAAYGLTVIPYVFISIINLFGSLVSSEYDSVVLVHSGVMDEMVQRGGVVEGAVGTVGSDGFEAGPRREAVKFSLEGGEGWALKGKRVGSFGAEEESFVVLPMEPLKPAPSFQLFSWRCRRNTKRQGPTQTIPSTPKPPTLTVPSHPPFTRLPPPLHQPPFNALALLLYISAYVGPYLIIYKLTGFHRNHSQEDKYSATIIWLVYGQLSAAATTVVEKATGRRGMLFAVLWACATYGAPGLVGYTRVVQMMREGTCPPKR